MPILRSFRSEDFILLLNDNSVTTFQWGYGIFMALHTENQDYDAQNSYTYSIFNISALAALGWPG